MFAKTLRFPGKVRRCIFVSPADTNTIKEAQESLIDLSKHEPTIVKLLVQYLYESEYDPVLLPNPILPVTNGVAAQEKAHTCDESCCDYEYQICSHHHCGSQCSFNCSNFLCDHCLVINGNADQLTTHSKMYEIADKYDVYGLKELCIEKYKRACLKFWDDNKFAESAYHAYTTTLTRDKGLRNVVCKTISEHMNLLKKPEVEDLMTEFNGLAFGLLFDKAEESGWCQ